MRRPTWAFRTVARRLDRFTGDASLDYGHVYGQYKGLMSSLRAKSAIPPSAWPLTLHSPMRLALDDSVEAPNAPGCYCVRIDRESMVSATFFADVHAPQSGPEPARLLVFGVALVGLAALLRRQMRGAANPTSRSSDPVRRTRSTKRSHGLVVLQASDRVAVACAEDRRERCTLFAGRHRPGPIAAQLPMLLLRAAKN